MTPSQASTIALALHPIDKISRRSPSSALFKTEMLHRADQFGRDSKGMTGPQSERMALSAMDDYRRIANNHGEQYYVLRFTFESTDPDAPDLSD